ncbi:MAG TPA: NUDIX hydrolase [Candidatus Nanoarchaeia archaeon]|nr:NUDIX hydrolase [Candidatus Nanoarchaeia archaeon]
MTGKLVVAGSLIFNDKDEVLLLFRKDHQHYETPGGKINDEDCEDPKNRKIEDLKRTAERELYEELGSDIRFEDLQYFTKVEFTIPDGRKAIAHKFVTKLISGKPKINEPEVFSKFDWLPIKDLDKYPVSPDLKLLAPILKSI